MTVALVALYLIGALFMYVAVRDDLGPWWKVALCAAGWFIVVPVVVTITWLEDAR